MGCVSAETEQPQAQGQGLVQHQEAARPCTGGVSDPGIQGATEQAPEPGARLSDPSVMGRACEKLTGMNLSATLPSTTDSRKATDSTAIFIPCRAPAAWGRGLLGSV